MNIFKIKIYSGLGLRNRETRLWRGNFNYSKFIPASRKGITYMLEVYFIYFYVNIDNKD